MNYATKLFDKALNIMNSSCEQKICPYFTLVQQVI